MENILNEILDQYLKNSNPVVDKKSKCYRLICKNLPEQVRSFLSRDDLIVKGSVGQGNKTDFPWVSILNRNITTSTQEGLYVVFLFKKDMSGFYLTLNQGITYFEEKYKSKKYDYARKVVLYFQSQIEEKKASFKRINLGAKKGTLGYGYEVTTITSYYFEKGKFKEDDIKTALVDLLNTYDYVVRHMQSQSYNDVIDQVLFDTEKDLYKEIDEALKGIDQTFVDNEVPYNVKRKLIQEVPYADRTNKLKKLTEPVVRKIDYMKKMRNDAFVGLLGEKLVMEYEKERLEVLGYEEIIQTIQWVSVVSNAYGYDIASFEIDEKGNPNPIVIEVKTTSSKVDIDFFVSKHELEVSQKLKENYWIYRVYDANSVTPKFYRANGPIEKNFSLDPVTYMAKYKFPRIS